nr:uncharacterized protein LOC127339559 [Lolium perenne]
MSETDDLEGGRQVPVPCEKILQRINSKKDMKSYHLGKQLSSSGQSGRLDVGEGKEIILESKCSRSKLQSKCIKYLGLLIYLICICLHCEQNSVDYAALGAGSKLSAILLTYPYQVIRARLQQRPGSDGTPKYSDSWHVVKETARYEGVRGFYRGITSNLLKKLPAASLTFVVYENVIKLLRASKEKT